MRDKVLYFPYIDVPESAWLTRMLLYWDTVGVIMPYQFVEEPENLEDHTRSLVQAGLLTQVFPSDYIGDIPNFTQAFLSYLSVLGPDLDDRRKRFRRRAPRRLIRNKRRDREIHIEKLGAIPIHLEKTSSLADELVDLGLAKRIEYPWLSVEAKTAEEFMYYLATVLGQHRELQFSPVTDELRNLKRLTSFVAPDFNVEESLSDLRLQILENVLPAPAHPIPVDDIELFKRKHGNQLSKFRRMIEIEITELADMVDPTLRKRKLELFKEEVAEELEDIQSKMTGRKWPRIVLGKLIALSGVVPGPVPSLIQAVYNAFGSHEPTSTGSPLAYAAFARHELLQ